MTVGYLIDLMTEAINLGQIDRETTLIFSADMEVFHTPCPEECGIVKLEESVPQINGDGTLDLGGPLLEGPIVMFALLPHNENNPHGDSTENDPGD